MHFGSDHRPTGHVLATSEELQREADGVNGRTGKDAGRDCRGAQHADGVGGGDRQKDDRDSPATANE